MQVESTTSTLNCDQAENEMCRLLGSLNLKGWVDAESLELHPRQVELYVPPEQEQELSDIEEMTDSSGNIQFIQSPQLQEPFGCELLQSLQTHLDWRTGPTSSNDFLEAIFTHRESFVAFPPGHKTCSKAFTQLGFSLERRAQDTGSDGDLDIAISLHNEAWLVSGWS